ncbi:ATP-dependent helicase [Candidatus Sumerlaeota bacterium]|nr:ATP-dependent helicase [Candidatus Sumerlaeota bacterium]
MKLTKQQQEAIFNDDNLSLVSCPGSGKTHTIVARMLRCIDEVKDTTRRIGCITYTNAAVNEIQYRLLRYLGRDEFEDKFDIGTIHSFCLNNIFRPNHWRLDPFHNGFDVLTPDDDRYKNIVDVIINNHKLEKRASENFELLYRKLPPPPYITTSASEDFWNRLDDNSYIDFNGIIYYSAQIVNAYPFVSAGLGAAFAWLLVDEFQDTSEYQVQILKAIASYNRTKFFIVGDPYQSIMSFAGGRPDLMYDFAKAVSARVNVNLSGNFRSSDLIVSITEKLQPRDPEMEAVGENKNYDFTPIWKHTDTLLSGIEDYFLPEVEGRGIDWGECAILAPNFYILCEIAPILREMGIPLIGPGARPYKRSNHLIAPLVEEICSYIEYNDAKTISTLRRSMQDIIGNCETRWNPKIFTFNGDLAIARIILMSRKLRDDNPSIRCFLERFVSDCATIMIEHELLAKSSRDAIVNSGASMLEDIEHHSGKSKVDVNNFSVYDMGLFARGNRSIKLLTLHKAKGREFDAVAIVRAHDGLIPYGNPQRGSEEESEARRLMYVGMTRARKVLMIFSDKSDNRRKPPSRFLWEVFPECPS